MFDDYERDEARWYGSYQGKDEDTAYELARQRKLDEEQDQALRELEAA